MFQPPVVIFQPPDLTVGAPARDVPGRGGRDTRRRGADSDGRTEQPGGREPAAAAGRGQRRRPRRGGRQRRGPRRPAPREARPRPTAGAASEPDDDADGPAARPASAAAAGATPRATAGRRRRGRDAAPETTATGRSGEAGDRPRQTAPATRPDAGAERPARRRRRRRRSGSGGDGDLLSSDDPPNTVVHVRAPRTAAEEAAGDVRAIKGSTRLEAKRQRRREGRETGRRRPPIITESEFLARREAVDRVMVVRQTRRADPDRGAGGRRPGRALRDKASHQSYVGNVYLGKVQNVLP